MSDIVFGLGVSHSPLLSTPPEHWDLRTAADRRNPALAWREGTYTFDELAELRRDENLEAQNALEVRRERFNRCVARLDALAAAAAAADPDVVVLIGDDQAEWFRADIQPTFAIFHGQAVVNRPLTEREIAYQKAIGTEYSMKVNYPEDVAETYPCATQLAVHMIERARADGFDIASCREQPSDDGFPRHLGHAFGFIYRRILGSRPIPIVPVLINTFFPPNQPTARRCWDLGRSIGGAIRAWPESLRVAVVASGGMSHFVIDEDFDRRMLGALRDRDVATLVGEPEYMFRSGSSEVKNWIATAGAIDHTRLRMDLLDYIPCYRSAAGTGNAMAFAVWQ